jgi:D-sedoheptulose 7-phosphate isomerase
MDLPVHAAIGQVCQTFQELEKQAGRINQIATAVVATLERGGKLLTCGNGGSAADAMHLAEELMGRYCRNRPPLPAVCLNADPTLLTCIANDFGYDEVFARQVEGLGAANDLLVCFTTSGNSESICRALRVARARGVQSVALLGKDGGRARGQADLELIVPSEVTARIQEVHTFLLHLMLEAVESRFSPLQTTGPGV